MHAHTYTHKHIHTHTHIHTCIHAHAHTHTYTHAYIQGHPVDAILPTLVFSQELQRPRTLSANTRHNSPQLTQQQQQQQNAQQQQPPGRALTARHVQAITQTYEWRQFVPTPRHLARRAPETNDALPTSVASASGSRAISERSRGRRMGRNMRHGGVGSRSGWMEKERESEKRQREVAKAREKSERQVCFVHGVYVYMYTCTCTRACTPQTSEK